jgi:GxxExxY protein
MNASNKHIIYKDECYAIVNGCLNVYRDKGSGFLEPVYQECMEIELQHLRIPAVAKPKLALTYRGQRLKQGYEPDFVCHSKIVLELKAVSELVDEHRAQVLNYLNATGFQLGILANFGHHPGLEWERIVRTPCDGTAISPPEVVQYSVPSRHSRGSRAIP